MAKVKLGVNADSQRGKRLSKIFKEVFGDTSLTSLGEMFGVSANAIDGWIQGASIRNDALAKIADLGGDVLYILTGKPSPAPTPNVIYTTPNTAYTGGDLQIIGHAAADNERVSRAGLFQPDDGKPLESFSIPETAQLVRVIGDSMEPVVLHEQLVMIDRELPPEKPLIPRGIYVAHIMDGDKEGFYCKRAQMDFMNECNVIFTSVNHIACAPFSALRVYCRLWPVIGVLFAGRGTPPES